jgi:hypothetical protein
VKTGAKELRVGDLGAELDKGGLGHDLGHEARREVSDVPATKRRESSGSWAMLAGSVCRGAPQNPPLDFAAAIRSPR